MNRKSEENKLKENIIKIQEFMYSKKFEKLQIFSRQYYRNIILNMFNNYSSSYSFIYGDFDKLNEINKNHGKDIGDVSLARALKIIKFSLPDNALISRIAGDEFSFILPNYLKKDCENFKKSIIKNLDAYRTYTSGLSITLGIEDSEKTPYAYKLEAITDSKMNILKHRKENNSQIELIYEDDDIALNNYSSEVWKILNQKIYSAVRNHIADLRFSDSFNYSIDDYKKETVYMIGELGKSLEEQCSQKKYKDSSEYSSPISHKNAALIHKLAFEKCTTVLENLSDNELNSLLASSETLSDLLIRNPLTHLYNKEYLNEFLLDNIIKSSSNYQVIFVSSSGVKVSNTAYGHDCTDSRLKKSGSTLKNKFNNLVNIENENFAFKNNSNFLIDLGGGNYISFIESSNCIDVNKISDFINKNNFENDNLKFAFSYANCISKKTKEDLQKNINKLQHKADLNKDLLKHSHINCTDNKNAFVNEFQECISFYLENIPNASTDISKKQQFLTNIFEALINESSKINSEKSGFER